MNLTYRGPDRATPVALVGFVLALLPVDGRALESDERDTQAGAPLAVRQINLFVGLTVLSFLVRCSTSCNPCGLHCNGFQLVFSWFMTGRAIKAAVGYPTCIKGRPAEIVIPSLKHRSQKSTHGLRAERLGELRVRRASSVNFVESSQILR